jgi:hypothetical protein
VKFKPHSEMLQNLILLIIIKISTQVGNIFSKFGQKLFVVYYGIIKKSKNHPTLGKNVFFWVGGGIFSKREN